MTQVSKKILEEKGNKQMKTTSVSIDSLKLAKWDIREDEEDLKSEEFASLKDSINMYGLFNPLTVSKTDSKYTIIAGKRRFKAVKSLGWTDVPVNVLLENATETETRIIKTNENLLIKSLEDVEQGLAIRAIYESAGYKGIDALHGTMNIYNWFQHHPGKKWNDLFKEYEFMENLNSSTKKGRKPGELIQDEKFVKTCQSIAISPSWQNSLLRLVVKLSEPVLHKAQKMGLPTRKKLLLTQKGLEKHPTMQEKLASEIAPLNYNDARKKVQQTARDLETGYIKPVPSTDDKRYMYDTTKERDIVEYKPKGEFITMLDVNKACINVIHTLTGRKLQPSEASYTKDMIDKTKDERMLQIVKNSNERELDSIYSYLKLTKYTIDEMMKVVSNELDVVEQKNKLIQK